MKILLILSFLFTILIFVKSLPSTNLLVCTKYSFQPESSYYEGWNFNSGNYLFTTDTK